MKGIMKTNELERAVVHRILRDSELNPVKHEVNFEQVKVLDRDYTGIGFLTEFERSSELKLFADGVCLRWGKVGARLNASKIETGYVLYVDNGYLTTIEGYTYREDWPDDVDSIEIYELKPGMELGTERKG
jgi:hypothetical protein